MTAPKNNDNTKDFNAVSALFGTSLYRSPGWADMEAQAVDGDRFAGTRKDGRTTRCTARVRRYRGEGADYADVWVETDDGDSWRFEYFCTLCRDVHPLPNVKEHAPSQAGAHSETGVEVQTTQDSADKAAGGGCRVPPCSPS
jgi:hypothetical protein